jgi:hypothetical protein
MKITIRMKRIFKRILTHPEKVGFLMSNPNWSCETNDKNKSAKNSNSSSIDT